MALVRVKDKFQVTIPSALRKRARIEVGDLIDATVQDDGEIRMRAKSVVDRALAEAEEDFQKGRTHGPFDTAEEMIAALHENVRNSRKKRKR